MQRDIVEKLIDQSFAVRQDLFLIDLNINQHNHIRVVIDGDQPVSVNDCMEVSRQIEHNLDREVEDFSLEVTSAGITSPLTNIRQYHKNIGKKLQVQTAENRYKAELEKVDGEGISLKWKEREPKPVGKGKHTVEKKVKLKFEDIIEAKVMITF